MCERLMCSFAQSFVLIICKTFTMDVERPSVMASGILELDAALAELPTQGLTR
jgi:hypothetical protein